MTHSSLTDFCMHSPNGYFPRAYGINKITIHHMAGVMSAEQCGYVFASSARQASSNYGIGVDGEIACYVEEENAAWTSSSYWNDNQAITLECSNSYAGGDWPISDATWNSMIKLCADICTRYGIEPYYDGTTNGTFTEHRMYAATGCPGEYIHERMYKIVEEVKKAMGGYGGEWIESDGRWWYRHSDGSWTSDGWEYIDGKWYYFDGDGWMKTGWLQWGGNWYYLQPRIEGKGYGYMVTGWKYIDWHGGYWFYFLDSGAMAADCFLSINGKWYGFADNGTMVDELADMKVGKNGDISFK